MAEVPRDSGGWMRIPEVALRLGCCTMTVRRMINDGRLPARKLGSGAGEWGGVWLVWWEEVERVIAKQYEVQTDLLNRGEG